MSWTEDKVFSLRAGGCQTRACHTHTHTHTLPPCLLTRKQLKAPTAASVSFRGSILTESRGVSLRRGPAADAPQSYEELLDFACRWAERAEAGEVGDIRLNALRSCGYLMDDRRYTLWLTDLLLDI